MFFYFKYLIFIILIICIVEELKVGEVTLFIIFGKKITLLFYCYFMKYFYAVYKCHEESFH